MGTAPLGEQAGREAAEALWLGVLVTGLLTRVEGGLGGPLLWGLGESYVKPLTQPGLRALAWPGGSSTPDCRRMRRKLWSPFLTSSARGAEATLSPHLLPTVTWKSAVSGVESAGRSEQG